MLQTFKVIFDGRVFLPERTVNLVPNRHYVITVEDAPDADEPDAWDVLDALTGTVTAPEDWSLEHDHYLYGSPKLEGGVGG
jgi:hypothetical protein